MRLSKALAPTLKEVPAEAQVVSHIFMIRGGYIRKVAAGVYSFLPLGWRVVRKVAEIVREEMNRAGAQEILMPALIASELLQETGRWDVFGQTLFRLKDRRGADFALGPTHEEVVVEMVRKDVKSYRQLPLNLYQIQTKFRDEPRPRAGLMRGREFVMKDAYSFHASVEDAQREYQVMYDAYARIFRRCGLEFRPVEADTGAIGGKQSHEFQVLAQSGEDRIVSCTKCDYAANVERAEVSRPEPAARSAEPRGLQKVRTPGKKTIDEVAAFLKLAPARMIKTLVYFADGKPVVVLVRGDHDVNEVKLARAAGALEVALASDDAVKKVTGAPVGFAGPVGLSGARILADLEVRGLTDAATGANEEDQHWIGVDVERDVKGAEWIDLRTAAAGDRCPRCGEGTFEAYSGIEVGHVFLLGTKYSEPMQATFLGEDGQARPMVMGCYGIGVTRVAAAAIEQNHDQDGIVWPMSLAPYHVSILTLQPRDADVVAAADRLYEQLRGGGIEVLYDDRDERPGAKFKDADLNGIPLRIAVGKKSLAEGKIELKPRRAKDAELVPVERAADVVIERVRAELARLSGEVG
jgi:prolyl-tRNA synthetase